MRKHQSILDEPAPRARRPRARRALLILPFLLALPPLYEGGQVLLGHWAPMVGAHYRPRTPVLDALGKAWRAGRVEAWHSAELLIDQGASRPSTAVPFAIGWSLLLATLFLRRFS